jgi:hypothetical protein
MTIRALEWYRVKDTKQYCQVASIMSTADPQVNVKIANEKMHDFRVALVWFTFTDETASAWTKRAILMELKKAFSLLREPTEEDFPVIDKLKRIANDIPFHSMSVDGTKTTQMDKSKGRRLTRNFGKN